MKISSRKTSLITAGTVLLLCSVLATLLLRLYTNIQEISVLSTDIAQAKREETSREQAARVLEIAKEDRETIEGAYFSKFSAVTFVGELETLAVRQGLTFEPSQIQEVEEVETDPAVLLSFETEGAEENTYAYLQKLENLPYAYRIENVSLFAGTTEEGAIVRGQFLLRLYLTVTP